MNVKKEPKERWNISDFIYNSFLSHCLSFCLNVDCLGENLICREEKFKVSTRNYTADERTRRSIVSRGLS